MGFRVYLTFYPGFSEEHCRELARKLRSADIGSRTLGSDQDAIWLDCPDDQTAASVPKLIEGVCDGTDMNAALIGTSPEPEAPASDFWRGP
jgi:hypothetical protein